MTCTKKVNYGNIKFAEEDIKRINIKRKMKLKSVYYCSECKCYHLTKKSKDEIY